MYRITTSTNHSVLSAMILRITVFFILLLGFFTVTPLAGLQEVPVFPEVGAQRVTQAPVIDGVLDEDVWTLAPSISDFVQQEPSVGSPATEKTQVKFLYDDDALYLGVRAFDSDVDGVVSSEMRRDSDRILDEDYFCLLYTSDAADE